MKAAAAPPQAQPAMAALDILAQLKALAERMEEPLKERAVREAVDGGAAVAVRPYSFRHPIKGQSDPFFGLAYHQWLALRDMGFEGIFTPQKEISDRAAIFIIFDRAAEFVSKLSAEQWDQLARRDDSTAHLRNAKKRKGAAA